MSRQEGTMTHACRGTTRPGGSHDNTSDRAPEERNPPNTAPCSEQPHAHEHDGRHDQQKKEKKKKEKRSDNAVLRDPCVRQKKLLQ
ncbi:hypothetical protein Tdes44962_MAKER05046 [Teratosphaeria destructans]|uniref:Uncharacterized protein n=1 Tax=Teratosphaeria destructans TaxID=418781 RepID=A0A9W7SLM3_9PEZI|nr:hypothetical protein Tdes44962_MAKER05046 [Teratosphaeria destructans]